MKPLRAFVTENRQTIAPDEMPGRVDHYSIPALDAGEPEFVESSTIDSHKVHLGGGELLISRLNPRKSRVHLSPELLPNPSVASTEFVTLRVLDGDSRYLRYLILSEGVRQDLDSKVRSATRSHQRVEPAEVLSTPVPITATEEQRRIADFLDDRVARIDQIINARRKQAIQVEALRAATLVSHIFEPGDDLVPCKAYADIRLGRQRAPVHESGDHMLPYLRSANVSDGTLLLDDVKTMNFEPAEQAIFALRPGDVLVTEGSASPDAVGASTVWRDELPGTVCFQNTLLRLRSRSNCDPDFLAVWARASHASGAAKTFAGGASILHLGTDGMSKLPIPRIPMTVQRDRSARAEAGLKAVTEAASELSMSVTLLTEYKQSLITAAVTGEIDVTTAGSGIQG